MLMESLHVLEADGKEGDWAFCDRKGMKDGYIAMRVPNGHTKGELIILPVNIPDVSGKCWGWDGNRDAPTLTPSIRVGGGKSPEIWHGFLRAGVMVTA